MRTVLELLPVTAFAFGLLSSGAARADRRHDRLDRGEILVVQRKVAGSDLPQSTVTAIIDVPPARVWKLIERCDDYKRYLPHTKESRELSRKGNVVVCRVTIDMPWPLDDLVSTTRAVHTLRRGFFRRRWSLLTGTYKSNRGSWTITPFDRAGKRSLVVYTVHAEPTSAVPKWLQRRAARSALPDLIEAVRRAVGHRSRK